jgi:DMSO/TMAO reductase YedYZ molybdopterin-dependent catalytic subunit
MRRRHLLSGLAAAAAAVSGPPAARAAGLDPALPGGTRDEAVLDRLPGKAPLIKLSYRPPNYETPFDGLATPITANDRFFVRYHLAGIPSQAKLNDWTLTLGGPAAERSTAFSLAQLKRLPRVGLNAVCQCAGNRRGFSTPHVAGVQWGSGAMGAAIWHGARLKDVLDAARVKDTAVEIAFNGMDGPVLPFTPAFHKSLPIAKAMSGDCLIAYEMNGQDLPLLNGFPARLIVPGWAGTYWMKHISDIRILDKPFDGFWMQKAYRVPKGMFPPDAPFASQEDATTAPITELVVNTLITSAADGTHLPASGFAVSGLAWDRGHGIAKVEVSVDGGASWRPAALGADHGPYAFRQFKLTVANMRKGPAVLLARATNNAGETQPDKLKFNPAGYQNNVPRPVAVVLS